MARKQVRIKYATLKEMNRVDQLLDAKPPEMSIITGEEKLIQINPEYSNKKRSEILSNESVKYVYSKGSKLLHDKTCKHVDDISNNNLCISEKYLSNKKQCPDCAIKSYIRAGGNIDAFNDYISFFEKVAIKENLIRHLFIEMKAKASISHSIMTLEIKGDKWKIDPLCDKDKNVKLLHCNTRIKKDRRVKYGRYYVVNSSTSISEAITIIKKYSGLTGNKKIKLKEKQSVLTKIKRIIVDMKHYNFLDIPGIRCIVPQGAIYYVDGDNCPNDRIVGIETLGLRDTVKIFYARNGNYFTDDNKREDINKRCKCKIVFIPIKPGPDAVDFAIGMDAYGECKKNKKRQVYFISRDKHFDVIKNHLEVLTDERAFVARFETLYEAKQYDIK